MASVKLQTPNTPEQRFCEQTEWMQSEAKDQLIAIWRQEDALLGKDDIASIVRLRQKRLAKNRHNLHALQDLAEAHLMAGHGQQAVKLLTPTHQSHPSHEGVQRLILEGLFMQGKKEVDFQWRQRIPVLRLGPKVVDLCRLLVTEAEGLMVMGELYEDLSYHGYTAFCWRQLARFLRRLPDFKVRGAQRQMWRLWVELPDMFPLDGAISDQLRLDDQALDDLTSDELMSEASEPPSSSGTVY